MKIKASEPCELCGSRVNLESVVSDDILYFVDVVGVCVQCRERVLYSADDFSLSVLKTLKGYENVKDLLEGDHTLSAFEDYDEDGLYIGPQS
jgi:hypothetical protein